MTTLSDAIAAYHIYAQAEGKSPKTILWIMSSMGYFASFLGNDPDVAAVTAHDLRRFIIALQDTPKFAHHPFNKALPSRLSPQSVETYCRAVRAFFGFLHREGFIPTNVMAGVKMPKVPKKVVPTHSEKEIERLLACPDKRTPLGCRDYALLLTLVDTAGRLGEIANLNMADVDFENGQLRVMGKGSRERYLPFDSRSQEVVRKTDASGLEVHGPCEARN